MSGYLDKDHVPLRTRERAAVEVARRYLRAIAQGNREDGMSVPGWQKRYAEDALESIARELGERS